MRICELLLGCVLLYAGLSKAVNPHMFATSLGTYALFSDMAISIIAIFVPIVEIVVGFLMTLGQLRQAASLIALVLTSGFLVSVGQAYLRKLNFDCGCFGNLTSPFDTPLVAMIKAVSLWLVALMLSVKTSLRINSQHKCI